MPVGQALGFVRQVPEDDMHSMNREQMLARLDVCMAGHVAEEIVYGKNKVRIFKELLETKHLFFSLPPF